MIYISSCFVVYLSWWQAKLSVWHLELIVYLKSNPTRIILDNSNSNFLLQYLVGDYETSVAQMKKKNFLKSLQLDSSWEIQTGLLDSRASGASWWEQLNILFCRGLKARRHNYLSWVHVARVLSTAIITGLLWWHSNSAPKAIASSG